MQTNSNQITVKKTPTNMWLKTTNGNFKVRYAFKREEKTILVVDCGEMEKGPFQGEFGDEIPNTKIMLEKYNVHQL